MSSDRHDYLALDWVRGEIQETLNQARAALEAYVDNPEDSSRMRFCQTHLHQVYGTLQMVEFYGAALLAEEMEKLAGALLEDRVGNLADGQETLMRAILQLPPYLDRVASSRRDLPVVLLPLLNDLRAARGEALLSETALFKPDMQHARGVGQVPESVRGDPRFAQLARKIRQMFQLALVGVVRGEEMPRNLGYMRTVFAKLEQITGEAARAPLWRVADALVEGLQEGAITLGSSVKQMLGQVDRTLRELAADGADSLDRPAPPELIKNLLYYIAKADQDSPRIHEVRARFRLDEALPSDDLVNAERERLSGPDALAMSSVVTALSEEITKVKNALEQFVHDPNARMESLAAQLPVLKQISDTVAMLGLGQPRTLVDEQVQVIGRMVEGQQAAQRDTLMDVAGALLYVEATLAGIGGDSRRPAPAHGADLPRHVGQAMDAVLRECRAGLEEAKDGIVEFIASHWQREHLRPVPQQLNAVRGGLEVVQLDKPARVLRQCVRFVEERLLNADHEPDWRSMDTLADAITSVEYYLERLSDDPQSRDDVLDLALTSVAALGYPLADPQPATPETNDAAVEETPATTPPAPADDDALVDQEIIDIFVEEAGEVLDALDQHFPAWAANTSDATALAEFRRAFHTLKGSGRMVGATLIGELAWAIENMLNRVIDRSIEASAQLIELVRAVREVIPALVDAFAQQRPPPWDVTPLQQAADTLARGETLAALPRLDGAPTPAEDEPTAESENAPTLDTAAANEPPARTAPDPVLLEIFRSEARGNLQLVSEWLAGLDTDLAEHRVDDQVHRALHTLKGSARMAEIEALAALAEPAEKLVKDLISGGLRANRDTVALLDETHRRLEARLDALEHGDPTTAPDDQALIERLQAARDAINQGGEGTDPHILSVFLSEGMDLIIDADNLLEQWAADPEHISELARLRAELELLAGSARTARLEEIHGLAGALAGCYSAVEQARLGFSARLLELVREGHEALMNMMDCLAAGQTVRAELGLVDALRDLAESPAAPASTSKAQPSTEAERDPELMAIFLEEAHDTLESAGVSLDTWMAEPQNSLELQSLQRDLHTLKGGARMVEIAELGDLGHELETLYEALGLDRVAVAPALDDLLHRCHDRLAEMVEALETDRPLPVADDLIAAIHAYLRDPAAFVPPPTPDAATAPAEARIEEPAPVTAPIIRHAEPPPALPDGLDPEILDVFLEESDELTEIIDTCLSGWRDQPESRAYGDDLRRALHTLKGGARLSGLPTLGEQSHRFETLITDLENQRKTPEDGDFQAMFGALDGINATLATLRQAMDAQPAPTAPQAAHRPAARREERRASAPPQEMVRVGGEVLEALVNLAGETSINRSRVEQSISEFAFNVAEMGSTVTRLYEQLRRLDVETEAQILSNYQKGVDRGEFDSRFDPLEMDQYSELHQITKQLSESASDLLDLKNTLLDRTRDTETLLLQQQRINTELQEKLMRTRMVPFSRLVPRLRRIVRQVSGEVGKRVGFEVINPDGELDRTLMERVVAPLEHMLRNAVDHGIESPRARQDAGKQSDGRITLELTREGGEVLITLADDGRGIDTEAVRRKAIERGLISDPAALSDQDMQQFIFHAGFSTASQVTQLSGRGVGMDVVASEIKQLGGSVMIDSRPGQGTRFLIRLPFTLAMNRALMVRVGEDHYAIPLNQIEGIVRASPFELAEHFDGDSQGYSYAGQEYQLNYLGRFVHDVARPHLDNQTQPLPVLLIRSADHSVALVVDSLTGSREVVVKSVGPQLASVAGISGATILGDGAVVIILDIHSLIRAAQVRQPALETPVLEHHPDTPRAPLVLVVDDSVTVRKVTTRLLERSGFEVITAKDGIDAIAALEEHTPDALLLDIEMPRMDGFEVATHVRHEERLKAVPIIMITSRTGDKHRERAFDIGVNSYLGKPFQESELLATLRELLGETSEADHR